MRKKWKEVELGGRDLAFFTVYKTTNKLLAHTDAHRDTGENAV